MRGDSTGARPRFGLVAVDLDGTLLNPAKRISPPDREALARAEREGVALAVISGRRQAELEALTAELPAAVFRAGHGGALIRLRGRTISEIPLPRPAALRAAVAARRLGMTLVISDLGGGVRISGESETSPRVARYLGTLCPRPRFEPSPAFPEDPLHLVLAGTPAECRVAERELSRELGDSATLERTEYPATGLGLLDVLGAPASKRSALERIAAESGVPLGATLAIGDNWNDLSMLEAAGLGVLMGNAEPELRALGFETTSAHDEGGVARALDAFLLGERPGPRPGSADAPIR